MKKKILFTAILAAAISVIIPTAITKAADETTVVTATAATTVKSGKWIHGGGWWYQYSDGTYPKETFAEINGKTYYFDKSGYMVTGWQTINNYSYYFDSNGAMVTGWQSIDGKWYYFSDNGRIKTRVTDINGKKQVFAPSGQWVSGWTFDRKIYYNDDGTVDWDLYNWYYANSDGTPYDYNQNDDINGGWLQYGGKWYYIDSDGRMLTNRMVTVYGKNYRLRSDGSMVTGWYQYGTGANNWYYSNADGTLYNGWLYYGKDWYYLDNGRIQTGWITSKGKEYYLGSDGRLASGWHYYSYISGGYSRAYWMYLDSDGSKYTGWLSYNGDWYYINKSSMVINQWVKSKGTDYYIGEDGKLKTGWYYHSYANASYSEQEWMYMNPNGSKYTGWVQNGGKWYYIDKSYMYSDCWSACIDQELYRYEDGSIDSTYYDVVGKARGYVFDKTGAMVTGWYHKVELREGNTYYDEWFYTDSDSQGHVGWLYYNGSWYYFKQGKMQRNCVAPDGSYLGADGISRKVR